MADGKCSACSATVALADIELSDKGEPICRACRNKALLAAQEERAREDGAVGGGGLLGAMQEVASTAEREAHHGAVRAAEASASPAHAPSPGATRCPKCGTAVRALQLSLDGDMVCGGCAAGVATAQQGRGDSAIYKRGAIIVAAAAALFLLWLLTRLN